jgi:hypothetical protein
MPQIASPNSNTTGDGTRPVLRAVAPGQHHLQRRGIAEVLIWRVGFRKLGQPENQIGAEASRLNSKGSLMLTEAVPRAVGQGPVASSR